MKLTKEERHALNKEIFDDMPENFRIFPPGSGLFLLEIMLLIFSSAIASFAVLETYHLHPGFIVFCAFVSTILVCAPNLLIVFGFTNIGIRLVRMSATVFFLAGITTLTYTESWGSMIYLNASPFLAAAALMLTYHVRFLAFAEFRKQNMIWVRKRRRKNQEFINNLKAKRQKAKKKR